VRAQDPSGSQAAREQRIAGNCSLDSSALGGGGGGGNREQEQEAYSGFVSRPAQLSVLDCRFVFVMFYRRRYKLLVLVSVSLSG
jgi:hypothetical protein